MNIDRKTMDANIEKDRQERLSKEKKKKRKKWNNFHWETQYHTETIKHEQDFRQSFEK